MFDTKKTTTNLAKLGAGWKWSGVYYFYACADGMHLRVIPADKGWVVGRFYKEGNAQSAQFFPSFKQVVSAFNAENA